MQGANITGCPPLETASGPFSSSQCAGPSQPLVPNQCGAVVHASKLKLHQCCLLMTEVEVEVEVSSCDCNALRFACKTRDLGQKGLIHTKRRNGWQSQHQKTHISQVSAGFKEATSYNVCTLPIRAQLGTIVNSPRWLAVLQQIEN